ncbi:MAG: hypothetical protein V3W41_08725 [Planctomycetota bacterium]
MHIEADAESVDESNRPKPDRNSILLGLVLLLAIGCRIWLAGDFAPSFFHLDVDDALYVRQAASLLDGEWLGPYDHRLLTKGPGFSIFLAGNTSLGLPRRFSESLFHGIASLMLFVAFRRIGMGRLLASLIFLLTLFHPVLFGEVARRVIRDGFYASLTLIVLALGIGLLARATFFSRFLQSAALGLATSWLFITRGEGVWILPALFALAGGHYLLERQRGAKLAWMSTLVLLCIPTAMVVGTNEGWSRLNEHYYGMRVRQELKEPAYNRAMGAIQRVACADWERYEPLSATSRQKLYAVSPAFASLRNWLESPAFRLPHMLAANDERQAVFLIFSVRVAVMESKQASTPSAAAEFYDRMAAEIEEAIAKGKLSAGGPRHSQYPEVRSELFSPFFLSFSDNATDLFQVEDSVTRPAPRLPRLEVDEAEREQFERILGREFGSGIRDLFKKSDLAERIRVLYSRTLVWIGVAAFLLLAIGIVRRRKLTPLLVAALVFLFAIGSRITLVSWLEAAWFVDVENYLIPAYPLLVPLLGAAIASYCPRIPGLDRYGWAVAFLLFFVLATGGWTYWNSAPSIILLEPSVEARILGRSGPDFLIAVNTDPRETRRGLMLQRTSATTRLKWQPGQQQLKGPIDLEIVATFGATPAGVPWSISWFPRDGSNQRVRQLFTKPEGQNTWRIPLGKGGVRTLTIRPALGDSAVIERIRILPALTRHQNPVEQAALSIEPLGPEGRLQIALRGAEIESRYEVFFAKEALATPKPIEAHRGLARIDPQKVLATPDGKPFTIILQTDTNGAAQAFLDPPKWLRGEFWAQAMSATSISQATSIQIKE